MFRNLLAAFVAAAAVAFALPADAGDIIDNWANVKAPPPPELKPVTIDPKTTALLMLDWVELICEHEYPRCKTMTGPAKTILEAARASGTTVIFTGIPNQGRDKVLKEVAPKDDEPMVQSFLNKYLRSDLEKMLKDKGITTLIAVGGAAEGAIISTVSDSAQRGFQVIVPVDTTWGISEYPEQYVAWDLTNAPVIPKRITLTRTNMIKF
jgi:nicotinamidase-related amidase